MTDERTALLAPIGMGADAELVETRPRWRRHRPRRRAHRGPALRHHARRHVR